MRFGRNSKLKDTYVVGVDIFLPYLREAKRIYDDVLCCDVRYLPIKSDSIDFPLATELIEHLEKKEGFKFLFEMDRVAGKQIVITTPVGLNPKHHIEDKNQYQRHKSAWWPSELRELGYRVYGFNGFRSLRGERAEFKAGKTPWCYILHLLSFLTQFVTYRLVDLAYQMMCIKVKEV